MLGVTVQLFEWSHVDVALECETFLGPHKFAAVQVSPPNEHITGPAWWTRYQPVSYALVSRSGNASAFEDMVSRCAAAGVDVYVDAVLNHMAAGSGVGVAGTTFGGRAYLNYTADEFHHDAGSESSNCVVSDYTSLDNVQKCDLEGLPDLCTECGSVQDTLGAYLRKLRDLGVRGFRLDAAKHQQSDALGRVLQQVRTPTTPYIYQEVIEGAGEAVTPDMYTGLGRVTEFRYASSAIGPNFVGDGKLQYLRTLNESWGLLPSDAAVVFLDNHDTQRGDAPLVAQRDGNLYFLAAAFMLAWPYGAPRVMSSYFFTDHDAGPPATPVHGGADGCDGAHWVCEHRDPRIAGMVGWRRTAADAPVTLWSSPAPDQIAFARGGAFIALNRGPAAWSASGVATGLPAGSYANVAAGDQAARVQVQADGTATFEVPPLGEGGVVALVHVTQLSVKSRSEL